MKKKFLCLFMSCCLIATLFTGCMQQDISTKISSTGKVTATSVCYVDKSSIEGGDGVTASVNGKDASALPVVNYNGVECYKDEEIKVYNSFSEYKDDLLSEDNGIADKVYEVSTETIYFSVPEDIKTSLAMIDSMGSKLKATVVVSYEFDKPIAQTNGVVDPANPNKVSYTFTSTSAVDEIFVSTSGTISKEKLKTVYVAKEKVKAAKLAKVKIKKIYTKKKSSNKVKMQIKKINGVDKYQVQVSKTTKFTKKNILVSKTVKKAKFTVKSKKLKNKRKLYVRVRTLSDAGKGKWSGVKKVKMK